MRYDIAVIGTGPAGVSAAITAKNRNKNIILLGSREGSEKVARSHAILNYPGLPEISGAELNRKFLDHLKKMDIEITDERVAAVYSMGDFYSLQAGQEFLEASTVIVTSGVSFGRPFPGEAENLGRGVSYCATCDAPLYRGKDVIVAGWAEKEEAEARFLAEVCRKVTYLPMYKGEAGTLPENVEIIRGKITDIRREDGKMVLDVSRTPAAGPEAATEGQTSAGAAGSEAAALAADGIFLLREAVAPGTLVPGLELDGRHVKVNRNMETNLPGLYAAGDLTGTPYQIAKAVGEGNIACLSAVSYLETLGKGTGPEE